VTPPDQGLAAGPSPAGPLIVEMLNDSLSIYSPSGKTLLGAIPSFELFDQRPSTTILFSDPRVY
jgi:hypothetical protein